MNRMKEKEIFGTYDIGLAAALIESGHDIDCFDRTNPNSNRTEFLFEKTPEVKEDANLYASNSLNVSARSYKNTLTTLKSKIFNQE